MNCHMNSTALSVLAKTRPPAAIGASPNPSSLKPLHPPLFASEGLGLALSYPKHAEKIHSNHGNTFLVFLLRRDKKCTQLTNIWGEDSLKSRNWKGILIMK